VLRYTDYAVFALLTFLFSLAAHRLTFASLLQEIPLRLRNNALVSAFVGVMTTPAGAGRPAAVPPSFASFDLGAGALSGSLTRALDAMDASRAEENNVGYLQRQIARARAQADGQLQRRRDENTIRAAQGLAPMPEDDILRQFRIPPEPSRLEGMMLLGQVDAHAHALEAAASLNLVKMYAAKASAGV
jgi:translation initiation factor 3 subunit H